jgi:peptidyl-prolyl cis-trans isomerase A (cyclophilin A)
MVQFGIHGVPDVNNQWKDATIDDDPVKGTNSRGMVSFATAGKDTRTTQIFVNYGNNANLDGMGFSPFGQIESGMEVVDALYSGYGEGAPRGSGPGQNRIQDEGNRYLDTDFPKMDRILSAKLVD